jgi:monovalent cation/hydrogen antiporter
VHAIEIVLGLLVAVALTVTLARRVGLPYPILLVIGGLALGLVPGLPHIELEPEIVFLVFLPPLLFAAGYFTSLRDFRANARPIGLLAIGLVLTTTLAVGVVAHTLIDGLSWPLAFVFGAIVSPPDAIAVTAIARRLGLPRRIVVILEGESLVNDATALVAYRAALAVALTGMFSIEEVALRFVVVAAGGSVIGLVTGWLVSWLLGRLDDPPVEVAITMLAPPLAFLPAEQLGLSGVLAVVVAGLYVGYRAPRTLSSDTRLLASGAWQMLLFVINGLAFILIGLQLPSITVDRPPAELLGLAAAVCVTVVAVRIGWVFPATYLPRWLSRSLRERDPTPPWQSVFVVSWAGMRGVVSLAAALSLPHTLGAAPFPERDLLVFLTFCVILVTLVGQGLSLPFLIPRLGVGDDGTVEHEEAHARAAAVAAAVERIDGLESEWPEHLELIEALRVQYGHQARHLVPHPEGPRDESERELFEHQQIRRAVIEAEREAVIMMRDRGTISDEVLRRIERDLDLEELRLQA